MGMSSGENVKVIEETSGCTRGGERFQEKRQRMGEGPVEVEVRYHEEQPHGMKIPFVTMRIYRPRIHPKE